MGFTRCGGQNKPPAHFARNLLEAFWFPTGLAGRMAGRGLDTQIVLFEWEAERFQHLRRVGFQLLLGPGTSGVDITFLFSVIDAETSRPRSTMGAPLARPTLRARIPSSPPAPRTDPVPSRPLAPPTRLACTHPLLPSCARWSSNLPVHIGRLNPSHPPENGRVLGTSLSHLTQN